MEVGKFTEIEHLGSLEMLRTVALSTTAEVVLQEPPSWLPASAVMSVVFLPSSLPTCVRSFSHWAFTATNNLSPSFMA